MINTGSWQPDPTQRHQYRFWDGITWTDRISDNGIVGNDPIAIPSAPHTAWTPPTAPVPAAPTARKQPWGIVIGVAALAVAGVVAFVYLGQDDSSGTPATAVATTATSVPATTTTTPIAITSSPTTTPATVAAIVDAATLVAAMPADAEVPADWSRYQEPQPQPDATGAELCQGPTDVARAIAAGSPAHAFGPSWDLPADGWFGVDIYYFPSESAAQDFLSRTVAQATTCTTTPVTGEQSEAEVSVADEWLPEDTVWQMTETAAANEEPTVNADQSVRVLDEIRGSLTHDGTFYSFVEQWIERWERHGQVVVNFWIGGSWGEAGWGSWDGAYQPTDADLDAGAAVMRAGILARLEAAGAL